MKRKFCLLLLLTVSFVSLQSQQKQGSILIITNIAGKVSIDGNEVGDIEANKPVKFPVEAGEHYVQVISKQDNMEKGETVTALAGQQKVLKITFDSLVKTGSFGSDTLKVADLNFNIPGTIGVLAWMNNNSNQNYPDYPTFYYAFEKDDEILIDVSMSNKKGTNTIEVFTYPGGVAKYSNNAFVDLKKERFKITERSIYKIVLTTNHAFDRNCFMKIRRIPAKRENANFNTNVVKAKIFTPVVVNEQQSYFVNSGSNAAFKGGKSRIIVPVNLPPHTAEWYYRFSASRNTEDIENVKSNFKLFTELTDLLLKMSGAGLVMSKTTNILVNQLSQPPGSDYCDIFLLTRENMSPFEAKQDENWRYIIEGSRKNLKSGNVKIIDSTTGNYYLGIKNPDTYYGINVLLEVVAITVKEDYVMEQK